MLAALMRPTPKADVSWSPLDPRWYAAIGARADAGPIVVPESALGIAVVYRAINVLAHSVASVPLVVYRRMPDGGKERAAEHPTYDLLHDAPNRWMTSFRWRHLMMVQRILWGAHRSQIMPGPGGIGALVPLSPETTRIVDQLADGRLVYVTRDRTASGYGEERRLIQDEVLDVRGFSIDGKTGIPLPQLARNAMGLALSAERHGSMFMRRGARHAGFLSTDANMDEPTRLQNEAAWQRMNGGADASGKTPLLTGGMKYNQISANNKDSQWLEARQFQVEELLRFLGVPGVLCGYADKTATYASAEQFFLSFVTHTVRPETENIAAELNHSVVLGAPQYFADFVLEGLLKGDIRTRYAAHQMAILSGWKSRNEVRMEENYNRGPAALDEFLAPQNMTPADQLGALDAGGQPGSSSGADTPADQPDPADTGDGGASSAQLARLGAIAERAALRLARKELHAIIGSGDRLGAARRFASNPEGWQAWLGQFYADHAVHVVEALGVSPAAAHSYCEGQRARMASLAGETPEVFESTSIRALMALLEE